MIGDGAPEYSVKYAGLEGPLANVREAIPLVQEEAAIVVDTVDPLERTEDPDSYVTPQRTRGHPRRDGQRRRAPRGQQRRARAVAGRDRSFADLVLDVEVQRNGSKVEHVFSVPKFRTNELPGERITLELSSELQVDTSRDTA